MTQFVGFVRTKDFRYKLVRSPILISLKPFVLWNVFHSNIAQFRTKEI